MKEKLPRRTVLKGLLTLMAGLGFGLKPQLKLKAQDANFQNAAEYYNSLPVIYPGDPPLLSGYYDWQPSVLNDPINIARVSDSVLSELESINPDLPDSMRALVSLVNSNNSLLVDLFCEIPEYSFGNLELFSNFPRVGEIRFAKAGDSNDSFLYNRGDYHVADWNYIQEQLFEFDPHEQNLRRVLDLVDPSQRISMETLLNTVTTTELQTGVSISQSYRSLVDNNNEDLDRIIDGERPNILHFSVGKMDSMPAHPDENFDPGELFLNARKAIQHCLSRNVVPIIILPNILDSNPDERHFVANPKGLAVCYLLYQLALEFNIPLINPYPALRAIRPTEITFEGSNYLVGAYGTGFNINDAQHYSRAGASPTDGTARLNMDKYLSTVDDFQFKYGHSAVTLTTLRFYSNLIDQRVLPSE
ncbi:MAG: hypothetical protein ABI721_05325 [Candidatus Dojkabacteria bacterium]